MSFENSTPNTASTREIQITFQMPNTNPCIQTRGFCLDVEDPNCKEEFVDAQREENAEAFTAILLTTGETKHFHILTLLTTQGISTQHVLCLHFPSASKEDRIDKLHILAKVDKSEALIFEGRLTDNRVVQLLSCKCSTDIKINTLSKVDLKTQVSCNVLLRSS